MVVYSDFGKGLVGDGGSWAALFSWRLIEVDRLGLPHLFELAEVEGILVLGVLMLPVSPLLKLALGLWLAAQPGDGIAVEILTRRVVVELNGLPLLGSSIFEGSDNRVDLGQEWLFELSIHISLVL